MPKKSGSSFATKKVTRYKPEFDMLNCERIHLADIDADGNAEIVIVRSGSSNSRLMAELAVYDLDLNLKAVASSGPRIASVHSILS